MTDISASGGLSPRQILERFSDTSARGEAMVVSVDGTDFKVMAIGQLSAASGVTRSVAWVQSDSDTTSIFLTAMSQSYGVNVSRAIANQLGLNPSPGKPLESRLVQKALEMATVSHIALGGVDFLTMLGHSAAAGGRDYLDVSAALNIDPKSIDADTRLWLDSQMKLRIENAHSNGQYHIQPAIASEWLKTLMLSLKSSPNSLLDPSNGPG